MKSLRLDITPEEIISAIESFGWPHRKFNKCPSTKSLFRTYRNKPKIFNNLHRAVIASQQADVEGQNSFREKVFMLRKEDFNQMLEKIDDSSSTDTGKMFKIAKWVTRIGSKSPPVVKIMNPELRDLDLNEAIAAFIEKLYC